MFLSSFLVLSFVLQFEAFQNKKYLRRLTFVISIVLIIVSGISTLIFPVYDIPVPSGEYSIGTESFVLIDTQREEYYGDDENRRIKIQVWYPAESTEGYELVPWIEDGKLVSQALAKDSGLPSFALNHTELIMSNAYKGAPVSSDFETYPVVVVSHGWTGFRNLHTDLAEELASQGYIVVGIDHTYGSEATVFSEDDVSYLNHEALPDSDTTPNFLVYGNTLVNTYAGDITFTINQLELMNSGDIASIFGGKFDLTNIGLLGHSTGGGAGVEVAINDERIKAIVGMDAWVEPVSEDSISKGLLVPSMFLRSGTWETGVNNINLNSLVERNSDLTRFYQFEGTTHYDFSMVYMYSPLTKYIGLTGEVEGNHLVSIFGNLITSFFDENLKNDENVQMDDIDDLWEEVTEID